MFVIRFNELFKPYSTFASYEKLLRMHSKVQLKKQQKHFLIESFYMQKTKCVIYIVYREIFVMQSYTKRKVL